MISNRQSRRRGRGGSRNTSRPSTPSRGNASQLLDKYKGLARDAQMSGDRVQAEYYLQFADHYHRVLEEHRQSQEEKQAQHQSKSQPKRSDSAPSKRDDGDQREHGQDDGKAEGGAKPAKPAKSTRTRSTKPPVESKKTDPKPKTSRSRSAPRSKDDDAAGGEAIADALPPAIGSDDDGKGSEAA